MMSDVHLAISILSLIIFIVFLLNLIKIKKVEHHAMPLYFVSFIMFIFNFVMALFNIQFPVSNNLIETIKTEFTIDQSLPRPNIYWIWSDGTMSIDSVKNFLGYEQEYFVNSLHDRDFVINYDASLLAGESVSAMHALFSPNFYDYTASYILRDIHSSKTPEYRHFEYLSAIMEYNLNRQIKSENLEFFRAIEYAGYKRSFIVPDMTWFIDLPSADKYIMIQQDSTLVEYNFENQNQSNLGNILNNNYEFLYLLRTFTGFRILSPILDWIQGVHFWDDIKIYEFESVLYNLRPQSEFMAERYIQNPYIALAYSINNIPEPRMVFIATLHTHNNFITSRQENFESWQAASLNSHIDQSIMLLNMVDLILEKDPYAIIVIQSDHGPHINFDPILEEFSEGDVFYMQMSVLSAVLIPEKFGGLEFPLDPRNISREIVNRFVGQNYNLIGE